MLGRCAAASHFAPVPAATRRKGKRTKREIRWRPPLPSKDAENAPSSAGRKPSAAHGDAHAGTENGKAEYGKRGQLGRGCERNSLTDLGCSCLSLLHQDAGKIELLFFFSAGFDALLVNTLLEPVTLRGGVAGLRSHGVKASAVFEKKFLVPLVIFCQAEGCPGREEADALGHRLGIFHPPDGLSVTRADTGGLGLLAKGFQRDQPPPLSPRTEDSSKIIANKKHPSVRQLDFLPMC